VSDELVLVVPRAVVVDGPGWHGIRAADPGAFGATVARHGRFAPRPAMERDPAFKQVIPYLVLRDGVRYFLMRRTRAGSDARLHDRFSIGVGGHLNPGDVDLDGGLRREWTEELDAGFVPDFRFVGLLNDDTTDVGSVHLGAVFTADAGGRPVRVRETDKLSGAFVDPADVAAVVDRMETWSSLVFAFLDGAEQAGSSRHAPEADGAAVR
jgi:predicted NUDIX family phosphoesterase